MSELEGSFTFGQLGRCGLPVAGLVEEELQLDIEAAEKNIRGF